MPIDTLKAARRLQEQGMFDEEQAERIAEVLSELDVASATAEDLHEMEERLTVRLDRAAEERASLEERFTARMDRLSDRIAGVGSRVEEVGGQLTDRFEARIAKLERRLLVAGVPALVAIVAILNYLMG